VKPKQLTSRLMQTLVVVAISLSIAPVTWAGPRYRVLHNFTGGRDGGVPSFGPLALDVEGNLYGAAGGGGGTSCSGSGCGIIFELSPHPNTTWTESVLYRFANGADGAFPNGGLVFDSAGNLYGATIHWLSDGTAFELSPGTHGWSLKVVYEFGSWFGDAIGPNPGLVFDKAGNLYGTGGGGNGGTVFELIPGPGARTDRVIYSFCPRAGCKDGEIPLVGLTWDSAGNLYGTTSQGGNYLPNCKVGSLGCGVAFQLTPATDGTWKYHLLHRFASWPHDAEYPLGTLVLDSSGNVYGTTIAGGAHDTGTVFKLSPPSGGGWKETLLYQFPNPANGAGPGNALVFDKAGNLYGTTFTGGIGSQGGSGVIFKLTPGSNGKWTYSVVHKFTGQDGDGPDGLTIGAKGNLYGTTAGGGTHNVGVVFEITP